MRIFFVNERNFLSVPVPLRINFPACLHSLSMTSASTPPLGEIDNESNGLYPIKSFLFRVEAVIKLHSPLVQENRMSDFGADSFIP